MSLAASDLPDDVEALKAIIAERDAKIAAQDAIIARHAADTHLRDLMIAKLRARLDKQLRDRFGSSSESLEQLQQAQLPSRPIERGRPGPGLIAHVLVSKYADHLPLYRQSQIYAREGLELERSTLADWAGKATALLAPLAEAIGSYVRAGEAIHADDTPVDVLSPGRGKTLTGRLWTYVRDERPWGSSAPPAALFQFSME